MNKKVLVRFSEQADEEYKYLKNKPQKSKKELQLLNAIEKTKERLQTDYECGTHIPRRNIPKSLIQKYGTDKLWKINLPNYWRLIYTIHGNEVEIISLILEFTNHKKYNKLFKYKS